MITKNLGKTIYMLEWWLDNNLPVDYTINTTAHICDIGRLDILELFVKHGYEISVNEQIIDKLARFGQLDIIQWFYNRDNLLYTHAIDNASIGGHVDVLDFFLKNVKPLKYTKDAIDQSSKLGKIGVLNWWVHSGLELKYSHTAIDECHQLDTLKWWRSSKLPLKYSNKCLNNRNKRSAPYKYLMKYGFDKNYTVEFGYNVSSMTRKIINYITGNA